MRIQVRMYINLDVDPEEYPMPSDGDVRDEFEDAMREYIHDIIGVKIKNIKVSQEIDNAE